MVCVYHFDELKLEHLLTAMLHLTHTVERVLPIHLQTPPLTWLLFLLWCLLFVLIRQGLRGGSGPLRLIRAPGIETGNPIVTFEQRSSFLPSTERAPHHTSTENPRHTGGALPPQLCRWLCRTRSVLTFVSIRLVLTFSIVGGLYWVTALRKTGAK